MVRSLGLESRGQEGVVMSRLQCADDNNNNTTSTANKHNSNDDKQQ